VIANQATFLISPKPAAPSEPPFEPPF
jgi:hypothetical protein